MDPLTLFPKKTVPVTNRRKIATTSTAFNPMVSFPARNVDGLSLSSSFPKPDYVFKKDDDMGYIDPYYDCMICDADFYGQSFEVMVDSGSSDNSMSFETVEKLGLKMEPIETKKYSLADDGSCECSNICRNVKFSIDGHEFCTDFHIMPGEQILLGVEWLVPLGPINWDFEKLTMDFTVDGKPHHLESVFGEKGQEGRFDYDVGFSSEGDESEEK